MPHLQLISTDVPPGPGAFRRMVEETRNATEAVAVPEILKTVAELVEHAAYVMTRDGDGAPVTRMLLLAAEIEEISARLSAGD
ncbi:hypothetical protein [Mameliella alba]|uniref:hypothetical protein n=1 Tax=Mameliella alba TaxID=561184 RepID=UPI001430C78D|nr:hypothetical protein [Mameliella alba]